MLITATTIATDFLLNAWQVFAEMAPYLLLGFLIAGVLHELLPPSIIERHLNGRGLLPSLKAALIGVPLPLCSCSVLPVTASIRQHGASRGATVAFLLSTPQTGVDSILVTYSLLGPVLALYRPIVAFIMGVTGGWLTDVLVRRDVKEPDAVTPTSGIAASSCGCHASAGDEAAGCCSTTATATPGWRGWRSVSGMLRYGLLDLPADLGKPLLLGMLVAAVITAAVPKDFFTPYLGHGLLPMLAMILLGIPMYVCASASVPVASALILAGVSPGAVLAFLITGPVTNAAEIAALWKVLGRATVAVYLATVVIGALLAGTALDWLLAAFNWRIVPVAVPPAMEHVNLVAALVMLAVFGWALRPQRKACCQGTSQGEACNPASGVLTTENNEMDKTTLTITGMTCNGCVNSVKRTLTAEPGVAEVEVDLASGRAVVSGDGLQVANLLAAVERLGFHAAPAE